VVLKKTCSWLARCPLNFPTADRKLVRLLTIDYVLPRYYVSKFISD